MLDRPSMVKIKLWVVDRIYPQSNKLAMRVENKATCKYTGDSKLLMTVLYRAFDRMDHLCSWVDGKSNITLSCLYKVQFTNCLSLHLTFCLVMSYNHTIFCLLSLNWFGIPKRAGMLANNNYCEWMYAIYEVKNAELNSWNEAKKAVNWIDKYLYSCLKSAYLDLHVRHLNFKDIY